jgi:2'-5' RNA ligase
MPARRRVFVALELPAGQRRALALHAAEALGSSPGVRLVPEADLHVTLVFCGLLDEAQCAAVAGETRRVAAGAGPCTLAIRGSLRLGSALALELAPDRGAAGLVALRERLAAALAAAALAGEDAQRPWLPHLTLARLRRGAGLPAPVVTANGWPAEVAPSGVAAFISLPMPGGVRYRPLARIGFNAGDVPGAMSGTRGG